MLRVSKSNDYPRRESLVNIVGVTEIKIGNGRKVTPWGSIRCRDSDGGLGMKRRMKEKNAGDGQKEGVEEKSGKRRVIKRKKDTKK